MTGTEFRKWRRSNDLTQTYIAAITCVNISIISRFEREKITLHNETYDRLMKFVEEIENRKQM